MEPLTGSDAADQILVLVGIVIVIANAVTMTQKNKGHVGMAKWLLNFMNVLAGNIFRNKNDPSL